MLERRIEEAALNSWPALQHMYYDGWLLRFARGYTKRANSVTPLYSTLLPLQKKIDACEMLYAQKRLPTIFRLLSFLTISKELDQLLAEREYQYIDHTLVLVMELVMMELVVMELEASMKMHDLVLQEVSLATWLPIFCQLSESPLEKHQSHREILTHIASRPYFAVLYVGVIPVACGLGVLEDTEFGLFDVITAANQRSKGYGTCLVNGMLAWAWQNKATYAYIQVVSSNQVARRVYERLRFQELYHYWYRVHPSLA